MVCTRRNLAPRERCASEDLSFKGKATRMRLCAIATGLAAAGVANCLVRQPLISTGDVKAAIIEEAQPHLSELLNLHQALVSIPSISGNEHDVGRFLCEYLARKGFETALQPVAPRHDTREEKIRYNVLAWRGGKQPVPKVLVTSHIDVVPPHIPYDIEPGYVSRETVIKGRGSVDAKGSVAAMVIALLELLEAERVKGEAVMLLFVVGEEVAGDGMHAFSEFIDSMQDPLRFDAVIFGEPTENKLACGHKGGLFCDIEAKGIGGHSGYPWLGKSANELMIRGLSKILETDLGSTKRFGNTTVNVGRFEGGVAANVIPEHAYVNMAVRVAIGPEGDGGDIVRERIEKILHDVDKEAFTLQCSHGYGFVEAECDVDGKQVVVLSINERWELIVNRLRYCCGELRDRYSQPPGRSYKIPLRPGLYSGCAWFAGELDGWRLGNCSGGIPKAHPPRA